MVVHMYAILLYSSHSENQDVLSSPDTDRGGDERSPQPGLRMRKQHCTLPSPRLPGLPASPELNNLHPTDGRSSYDTRLFCDAISRLLMPSIPAG